MSSQTQNPIMRDIALFAALGVLVLVIFVSQGAVY